MKIDELKDLFKEFGEHVKFEHDLKWPENSGNAFTKVLTSLKQELNF